MMSSDHCPLLGAQAGSCDTSVAVSCGWQAAFSLLGSLSFFIRLRGLIFHLIFLVDFSGLNQFLTGV